MRNFSFLVIVLFASTLFNACSEKDLVESGPGSTLATKSATVINDELTGINFSVDDNCLNFETEEDFQALLDYLVSQGDPFFPEFEKTIGFESYRQHHVNDTTDVIEDDLIATVINPEAEIQIAGYLFKIDFDNEVTQVYRVANILMTKSDVIEQVEPVAYGWDDDFFGDDEPEITTKGRFCGDSDRIKEKNILCRVEGTAGNIISFTVKAKLCYQRFTFVKTIISKMKTTHGGPWGKPREHGLPYIGTLVTFRMQVDGTFQRKNRSKITVNEDKTKVVDVKSNNEDISWRPFHGTRRVRNYNLTSNFSMAGYKNTEVSHPGNSSELLQTFTITCN